MQIPRQPIYCQNPLLADSITCKFTHPAETHHEVRQVVVLWARRSESQACSCVRQRDWSQCGHQGLERTAFDLVWSSDLSARCTRHSWTLSTHSRSPPQHSAITTTISSTYLLTYNQILTNKNRIITTNKLTWQTLLNTHFCLPNTSYSIGQNLKLPCCAHPVSVCPASMDKTVLIFRPIFTTFGAQLPLNIPKKRFLGSLLRLMSIIIFAHRTAPICMLSRSHDKVCKFILATDDRLNV